MKGRRNMERASGWAMEEEQSLKKEEHSACVKEEEEHTVCV